MKAYKLTFYLAAILLISAGIAFAASPGSTSANFLKIPVGARSIGMGESFMSVADDCNAIYWNPAGMKNLSAAEISFMHSKWFSDMSYQYLTGAMPIDGRWSAGGAVYSMNYGEINGADYTGARTRNIAASDMAAALGAAASVNDILGIRDDLYAGMTLKYINQSLDAKSAGAITADVGLLFKKKIYDGILRTGLSGRNLTGGLKFVSEEYPLPSQISLGASYTRNIIGVEDPLTVAVEMNMPSDNKTFFNVGAEYWAVNLLAVRLGYKSSQDIGSGFRAGIGIRAHIFQFDMAFGGFDKLGDTYHFGVTLNFGAPVKPRLTTMPLTSDETDGILNSAERLYNESRYLESVMEYNKVLDMDPTNKTALDMMRKANEKLQEQNNKN